MEWQTPTQRKDLQIWLQCYDPSNYDLILAFTGDVLWQQNNCIFLCIKACVCEFALYITFAYSFLSFREGKKEKILTSFSQLPPQPWLPLIQMFLQPSIRKISRVLPTWTLISLALLWLLSKIIPCLYLKNQQSKSGIVQCFLVSTIEVE